MSLVQDFGNVEFLPMGITTFEIICVSMQGICEQQGSRPACANDQGLCYSLSGYYNSYT